MKIDLAPYPKPRMTRSDRWKKRPTVLKYWEWKSSMQKFGINFDSGQVDVIFFVPMPKSWTKSKRLAHDGKPHKSRPDIDNFLKALFDAVCDEDSHIHTVHAKKVWSTKGMIELNNM